MSGSAPGLSICRGCRLHFMLRPACLLPARGRLSTPRSGRALSLLDLGPATRRSGAYRDGTLIRWRGVASAPIRRRLRVSGSVRVTTHHATKISSSPRNAIWRGPRMTARDVRGRTIRTVSIRRRVQVQKLRNALRSSNRWPGQGLQFRQPPKENENSSATQLARPPIPPTQPANLTGPSQPSTAAGAIIRRSTPWSRERVEGGVGHSRARPRSSIRGMAAPRPQHTEHCERRPSSGVDRRPPTDVERGPRGPAGAPASGDRSKVRRARHAPPTAFPGGQIR
jgi:hypothetical protein